MKRTTNQNIEKVCFITFVVLFAVTIVYNITDIITQGVKATTSLIEVSIKLIPLILLFIYVVQKEKKQLLAIIGLSLLALCEIVMSIILDGDSRIFLFSLFFNPYGGVIDSLLLTVLIVLVLLPCGEKWINIFIIVFMSLSFVGVTIWFIRLIGHLLLYRMTKIALLFAISFCNNILWHTVVCFFLLLYKRKWSHQDIKTKNSLEHVEKNSYDETITLN